jgi:hypothetical protein
MQNTEPCTTISCHSRSTLCLIPRNIQHGSCSLNSKGRGRRSKDYLKTWSRMKRNFHVCPTVSLQQSQNADAASGSWQLEGTRKGRHDSQSKTEMPRPYKPQWNPYLEAFCSDHHSNILLQKTLCVHKQTNGRHMRCVLQVTQVPRARTLLNYMKMGREHVIVESNPGSNGFSPRQHTTTWAYSLSLELKVRNLGW